MEITNRQAYYILIFILSVFVIGSLTGLSWFLAFANDEQGAGLPETIGYCAFLVFRFPTHNLIWLRPDLISSLFFPGLMVNVILYSVLTTFIVAKAQIKMERKPRNVE
jgi:hypothetical protein